MGVLSKIRNTSIYTIGTSYINQAIDSVKGVTGKTGDTIKESIDNIVDDIRAGVIINLPGSGDKEYNLPGNNPEFHFGNTAIIAIIAVIIIIIIMIR